VSKKLVILGSGESGTGAALLAKQQGYDVFVSDKSAIPAKYKDELLKAGVDFEEGGHDEARILAADEIIKSPGIPDTAPLIQQLIKKGTPVISEIEFAALYTDAYIIAITGTNGKTTTTSLIYHLLKKAGLNVACGGNIGTSFARLVAHGTYDYFVLEISSFQLDNMYRFKANIAVLTNITPDHLDRYDYQLQNYVNSKFRILQNQTAEDFFIYCADDEVSVNNLKNITVAARMLPFSIQNELSEGAWEKDKAMVVSTSSVHSSNPFHMYLNELALKGKHNTYNSMAAAIVGQVLSIRKEVIRESLTDFENVEHRLEHVATVQGIDFINDSKATNVNSAWYALESMEKPVIWIAGGVDKGNDYEMLKPLIKEKVRMIVCLGIDNRKIHEAFQRDVEMIVNTTSAKEAVHVAYKLAKREEAVLLSPACASFDLFENYEDRGRQFKKAVREL
jgi:UDP-N-acetylmuramoylalanine--D-glutamate ligase